jgi:hypothetical protein
VGRPWRSFAVGAPCCHRRSLGKIVNVVSDEGVGLRPEESFEGPGVIEVIRTKRVLGSSLGCDRLIAAGTLPVSATGPGRQGVGVARKADSTQPSTQIDSCAYRSDQDEDSKDHHDHAPECRGVGDA